MTQASARDLSNAVLIVAPTSKDAAVTLRLLQAAAIEGIVELDFAQAAQRVDEGIGAVLLTDLVMAQPQVRLLLNALARQPQGMAVPVLLLSRVGHQSPLSDQLLGAMGNVNILDRPTSTRMLVSALRSALRGRQAQYQIRDQIQRLRTAEEALLQADRRKDEFLATLAHELRNPLAPLRNGITLLQQLPPDHERVGVLRSMMDRQLTQLVKLIDDLLDVSRIATGKITLERRVLDMREVVRSALESCEPAIHTAQQRLTVELPDRPALLEGDFARLAQVVSNVVGNACKYTPTGGDIRVRLEQQANTVVLSVIDNGAGIPADMLDHVFDLFAQINQTLDRAQGGLGIGLSLVRRLVQLHGGRVAVRSEGVGRGSTFELHLPAAQASAPANDGDVQRHAPPVRRKLRLMVIDDNVDAADSLGMLLSAMGHEAVVTYSASAALTEATRLTPEVVFCDIGMPGMDGLAFAEAMRSQPRFEGLRLVALTGWGSEDDKGRTRAAGFDYHLIKPADAHDVEAVLAGM